MIRTAAAALFVMTALIAVADAAAPKPWLGMALVLRAAPDGSRFIYVGAVAEGTPAAKAGMAAGDVVTAIDGRKIAFRDDLAMMEYVTTRKPGEALRLEVIRGGKTRQVVVKVGELPREYEEAWQRSLERARELRKRSASQ